MKQLAPQMTHAKRGLNSHQSPTKVNLVLWHNPKQNFIHCSQCQSSQPVILKVNPTHWCANSNQGPTTTGGHTQYMLGTPLEILAEMIREAALLGLAGHLLYKATFPRWEMWHIYIIHRSKNRDTAKIRTQRNMSKWKNRTEKKN